MSGELDGTVMCSQLSPAVPRVLILPRCSKELLLQGLGKLYTKAELYPKRGFNSAELGVSPLTSLNGSFFQWVQRSVLRTRRHLCFNTSAAYWTQGI